MNPLEFSATLETALRWSARGHRDQLRKSSNIPYIAHPVAVAMILTRFGFDDDSIQAAALLHDLVEDTPTRLEELQEAFPADVVAYVAALTEENRDDAGVRRCWEDRKRDHIEHIAHAPWQARAIALADKYHNLYSMQYDIASGADIWSRFGAAPERILWYHRSMIEAAFQEEEQLAPLAEAGIEMLQRVEECLARA